METLEAETTVAHTEGDLQWSNPESRITVGLALYAKSPAHAKERYGFVIAGGVYQHMGGWKSQFGADDTIFETFDEARAAAEKWAREELPKLLAAPRSTNTFSEDVAAALAGQEH